MCGEDGCLRTNFSTFSCHIVNWSSRILFCLNFSTGKKIYNPSFWIFFFKTLRFPHFPPNLPKSHSLTKVGALSLYSSTSNHCFSWQIKLWRRGLGPYITFLLQHNFPSVMVENQHCTGLGEKSFLVIFLFPDLPQMAIALFSQRLIGFLGTHRI